MITPLDPVIAQIIPLLPLRDPTNMTPQSARDALRSLAASRADVPPPPVMSTEDIKVKGATGFLSARAYRNSNDKLPTVVFFHGGGWVAGDLETHDRQARWLAIETGAVVVSVDYRRPPEVRFPGAFEDAFAATKDVIARIAEFGGDEKRIGVAGDSAGGNLAASIAIACRDAGIKLAGQLLAYPVTDVVGNFADARRIFFVRHPASADDRISRHLRQLVRNRQRTATLVARWEHRVRNLASVAVVRADIDASAEYLRAAVAHGNAETVGKEERVGLGLRHDARRGKRWR